MGVISHKKGKICLKGAKKMETLDKNYRTETNLGIFSKRTEGASIVTMGPRQISNNYKNNNENKKCLPLDELAAPFFGEKASVISVKNKI